MATPDAQVCLQEYFEESQPLVSTVTAFALQFIFWYMHTLEVQFWKGSHHLLGQ